VGNALWLFRAVPVWYCSTIASPFGAGYLTAIPALGILSLAIGVVAGFAKRELSLLIFLLPLAASQILVVVAGFLRGAFIRDPNYLALWIIGTFMLLQIAGAAYIVWRLKGARWPAAAIAIFTSSYASFAAFVAAMAFTDSWL
jgi:tetrahydromethanopterin S-methyltransferase subunit C